MFGEFHRLGSTDPPGTRRLQTRLRPGYLPAEAILLQQGTDLRAVIDILAGQLGGNDLSCVGVHPDMKLSPGPTHLCGVLLDQPLTGTAELEPSAVHQQVDRFAAGSWSRHRQCLAPSADRRMVGCCEIKIKQSKKGCDQPFGLA